MKQFVDREQEMETLQSEYEREGSSLVVLYGRRRVGKTTLITEFIQDKNGVPDIGVNPRQWTRNKKTFRRIALVCS